MCVLLRLKPLSNLKKMQKYVVWTFLKKFANPYYLMILQVGTKIHQILSLRKFIHLTHLQNILFVSFLNLTLVNELFKKLCSSEYSKQGNYPYTFS